MSAEVAWVVIFLLAFYGLAATLHMIDMRAEIQRLSLRKSAQTDGKPLMESGNEAENGP